MGYGESHGYKNKEENNYSGGKSGSKVPTHKGPAAGGKLNAGKMKGVFREPKGKA
jgi:hypothetical protein